MMNCELCKEPIKTGFAVVKKGNVTEEGVCKQCSFALWPNASAEIVLFVKHMEDYHRGILARDAGARGFWGACKDHLKERGLL